MNRVRSYFWDVLKPVFHSPRTALLPGGDLKEFLTAYTNAYLKTWVLRGFLGGLTGFGLAWALNNPYFSKAPEQAVSPELWNIIVAFGFMCALLGVLAQFVKLNWIAQHSLNSARALLVFGSEVGAIGYGVLMAMLVFAVAQSEFDSFKVYFYTSVGIWLMIFIAFLNLVVFWVLYCLQSPRGLPVLFSNLCSRPIFSGVLCILLFLILLIATVLTKPNN